MPVILSDETWLRIEKMLEDYESGVLRVAPGKGLKYQEQITAKYNCPGTTIGLDIGGGITTVNLDVCVDGSPVNYNFLVSLGDADASNV